MWNVGHREPYVANASFEKEKERLGVGVVGGGWCVCPSKLGKDWRDKQPDQAGRRDKWLQDKCVSVHVSVTVCVSGRHMKKTCQKRLWWNSCRRTQESDEAVGHSSLCSTLHLRVHMCVCVTCTGLLILSSNENHLAHFKKRRRRNLWQTHASCPSWNPYAQSALLAQFGHLLHISHLLSLPGAEDAALAFHKAPNFDIWWPR